MNDDVISNDEWPLGYNSGMHSFDRMKHLRRNDSLNMQSPPIHGPRAIRGSSPYSDCSSPTRESHGLFGPPRAITNTRSNSPVYNADPTFRDFKTFLPATEQELANICQLHALRHATSSDASSQYAAAHGHISRLMQCEKGQQMLSELFKSMQIQQQLSPKLGSQSWPSSPQVDNSNEFNFSAMSSTGSSNGSSGDKYGGLYGRNYYGNVNTEQALFEEAARKHRTALASMKQENCPCYSGEFPIRENKNPTYSVKDAIVGTLHSFKSVDCVTDENEATNYPTEFLNSLDVPGLPPTHLQLKVGSVVIMLRNLNQPKLCNGTRLVVTKLMTNVIEGMISKGKFKGEEVLIPKIPMIQSDMPFDFKRIQFPIRLAFAMTINKSQGQSLEICGLNLENGCFSHGQLYVACSRVGKPSALFVFAPENKTKNVVYQKVLQ
ncbi:hypothetical protein LSTR_LSTR014384 [Laodelphax striatellus]|uniref:DNA helicase Pif1-like 2B domain-containing protein n=1 Tax=Laodelphax striatellus TaxID=195883 RepID=A0A482WTR5_LAOST|nr:hypothetical protein LSTR_LSTR014384 [Laodelphax striatellus]